MVAGRYHGILLSCVAGVPVVATPSQGRMTALARQMGLTELAVPADRPDPAALRRNIHAALAAPTSSDPASLARSPRDAARWTASSTGSPAGRRITAGDRTLRGTVSFLRLPAIVPRPRC